MGHLRENGFKVNPVDLGSDDELMVVKSRNGITPALASCHTALVDGYVIEGHVPADVIVKLLQERPDVKGLAVPGMPVGSPGMEDPSGRREPYDVLAFDEAGKTSVYASRR